MDLTFFTREADGRYRRFDELHVEKAHAPEHLMALMARSGFVNAQMLGDRRFDLPAADEPRVHIAAIRE
jgi:hypothetical protein